MKKIINYILIVAISMAVTSCDSFLDTNNYQEIPEKEAFKTLQDVQNGLVGAYSAFGSYRFHGRNLVALGDMAADIGEASPSYGHFVSINKYTFQDSEEYLKHIWMFGYRTIDATIRIEEGVMNLEDELKKEEDIIALNTVMTQAYSLRALSYFMIVNVFALPYQPGEDNIQLGIPVLSEIVKPFEDVQRNTVEEVYTAILEDIENAKVYMNKLDAADRDELGQFYMNEAAIYALEARVNLFMGEYATAKTAAQKAIDLRSSGDVSNEFYVNMWKSVAVTDEDIFTIAKNESDNLSANSLNTLYGSYYGALYKPFLNDFAATDTRLGLVSSRSGLKYPGTSTSRSVNNIPVFRKSEMYLTIAECEAQLDNLGASKTALLYTAKRNTAIASESNLPSAKADLLTFISVERKRELFQEGHRWYDARRTGEVLADLVAGKNFDVAKFVYPIPVSEINGIGGVSEQNPTWRENYPKTK